MRKRLAWLGGILAASLALTVIAADAGLPKEFSDYHRWHRTNLNKSFDESAHPVMKDIYFNEAAAEGLSDGEFSFLHAEGSIFGEPRPETLIVQVLTVMRKVEGFDPDIGDGSTACGSAPVWTATRTTGRTATKTAMRTGAGWAAWMAAGWSPRPRRHRLP